nr:hypothetical protein [uncultured Desulfobacter sp.]
MIENGEVSFEIFSRIWQKNACPLPGRRKKIRPRVGIKSSKIWRRIFEPYSRRSLGSILKYVPKGATKKKAKKASHMGEFILIMGLNV